ncbi:hypothetical protein MYP_3636 [Sporocytophaga myxococcoides]|uniref:Uncharacterized protein n=2 Tax=Sporocytophaga myxococcoides TaxID=153721 RepID=A0A098LJ48_9BACT|nr:hypothetical protein MYP_3636 [Sporocytophaga myxococcoides]
MIYISMDKYKCVVVNGYLIKEEDISWQKAVDGSYSERNIRTSIYNIYNGNAIYKMEYKNGTLISTTTYEFYSDLINQSGSGWGYTFWPESNGRLSKNLLKKEIIDNGSLEYFYELDQYGNVIKQKKLNK